MLKQLYLIPIVIIFLACGDGPKSIDTSEDACSYCYGAIKNPVYASQVQTLSGEFRLFDSIECMVAFLNKSPKIKMMWVVDYNHPKNWIEATNASYLQSDSLHSPRGVNMVAFKTPAEAADAYKKLGGMVMNWQDAKKIATIKYLQNKKTEEIY